MTRVRKARISSVAILIILAQVLMPDSLLAREISKAGVVFQDVKDGVVTVFTSRGHGSGFLIDRAGLIVTNSHVTREAGSHLRVKFGKGEIVAAKVLTKDREADLAVLLVNLKNVKSAKPLQIFEPGEEELVLVGEKVLAIGSPLDRIKIERTMSEGVVGKFDGSTILHDAEITFGNSGGPLLNFDGKVVGINTFGRGSGPGAAVPVTRLPKVLGAAREKLATVEIPSEDLLPDVPDADYPISRLLRENPDFFSGRKPKDYKINSNYFEVFLFTPPQGYSQMLKREEKILQRRKARAKRKKFEISDDEFESKNRAFYNYELPVVTVFVLPKPKLTTGTKVIGSLTFLTAATATVFTAGIAAPLLAAPLLYNKQEYKKDFLELSLVDEESQPVAVPIETGRLPLENQMVEFTDYSYKELVDKTYCGKYTFDPRSFDTEKKLKFLIGTEGDEKERSIKIPEKIKVSIRRDFEPYWHMIEERQKSVEAALESDSISRKGSPKD